MNSGPLVSVLVMTYNSEKYVDACLRSLLNQDYTNREIIVIDGYSTDRTLEIVSKYPVRLYFDDKHSIVEARKVGLRVAQGAIIALIDSDCTADKDWLKKIVGYFDLCKDGGMVGGPYVPPENGSFVAKCTARAHYSFLGAGNLRNPRLHHFRGNYCLVGGNMAIRRDTLRDISSFSSSFSLAGEDLELSCRAVEAGYRIIYSPDIAVRHGGWDSFGNYFKKIYSYGRVRPRIVALHKELFAIKEALPPLFIIGIVAYALLSVLRVFPLIILAFALSIWLGASLFTGISLAWNKKRIQYLFGTALAVIIQHLAYGLGYLNGVLEVISNRTKPILGTQSSLQNKKAEIAYFNLLIREKCGESYEAFDAFSDVGFKILTDDIFQRIRGGLVLDVGCGPAAFGTRLSKSGFDVIGIDLSTEAVKIGKRRAERLLLPLHFVVADAENMPFRDHTFDLILCGGVLHHFRELGIVARNISHVTKVGGMIFALEPNGLNPLALLRNNSWSPIRTKHTTVNERTLTPNNFRDEFLRVGFEKFWFTSKNLPFRNIENNPQSRVMSILRQQLLLLGEKVIPGLAKGFFLVMLCSKGRMTDGAT